MAATYGMVIEADPNLQGMIEGLQKADSVVIETIWEKTQALALGEEKMIKGDMPVDTGRARASWGHFTPGDLAKGSRRLGTGKKITKKTRFQTGKGFSGATQVATAGDAIWEEDKTNLAITQGTHVPYTVYLNDGTSTREGLLFVDRAEEWAENQMESFSEAVFGMVVNVLMQRENLGTSSTPQTFRMRIPGSGGERITITI